MSGTLSPAHTGSPTSHCGGLFQTSTYKPPPIHKPGMTTYNLPSSPALYAIPSIAPAKIAVVCGERASTSSYPHKIPLSSPLSERIEAIRKRSIMRAASLLPNLLQRSLGDDRSPINKNNAVAYSFSRIEHMRTHEHAGPAAPFGLQRLRKSRVARGSSAHEGLVHHINVRLQQESDNEHHFLLHAFGEPRRELMTLIYSRKRSSISSAGEEKSARPAHKPRQRAEGVCKRHILIKHRLFGYICSNASVLRQK